MINTHNMHFFVYRFLIITCTASVISCLLSTLLLYNITQKELSKSLTATQHISTELLAENITQRLEELSQILYVQAKLKPITNIVNPQEKQNANTLKKAQNYLDSLYFQLDKRYNLMIIDIKGDILVSTSIKYQDSNVIDEPSIQDVLTGRSARSMQIIGTSLGQDMIAAFAEAITINDQVVGVLAITIPIKSIFNRGILDKLSKDNQLETYLFDADGTVLVSPKNAINMNSARNEEWFLQFRRNPLGSFTGEIYGVPSMINFTHIPSTTWTLMLIVPESVAFAPITNLLRTSILTNALLLIATMLSIILLIRKPIMRIQTIESLQNAVRDASQNMYLITSTDMIIQDATDPLLEALKIPSKEHFIQHWKEYIPTTQPTKEVSREIMSELFVTAQKTGKARAEMVFLTHRKEHIPLEIVVVPLVYQKQHIFLLAFSNLQEQKAYEESLKQAQYVAEEASKSKSEFLANMSHEIRTPMNAIVGMAHLAKLTNLTPKQFDYLQKIEIASKSLLIIINDILDFSKIEAGRLDIEEIPFALQDVLSEITIIINNRIQEKDIELLFDIDLDVPPQLIGDPIRLSQVLTNLLTNAVKFTQRGEIVVSIKSQSTHGEQIILTFSVRDTGIGMEESQIGKLFDPFTQADASTTRRFGGTGLGLTICKRLVGLMQGKIWATSTLEKGSTFTFNVKLKNDIEHRQTEKNFEKEFLKGLTVLIVDDNSLACDILKEMLEYLGMCPTTATSGQKALEIAKEMPPFNLVIMDLRMPYLNGIETASLLREYPNYQNIPFVLTTAYEHDDALKQCNPFNGILAKPVSASSLVDILAAVFITANNTGNHIKQEAIPIGLVEGHVLLAEDNIVNQQVAAEMLESLGLQVTIVANGQEALDAYHKISFDAIFMDIQMPVMDGFEATKLIRENEKKHNRPRLKIIAMTAHALTSDYQRSLNAGMDEHITKPIDPEALMRLAYRLFAQDVLKTTSTE